MLTPRDITRGVQRMQACSYIAALIIVCGVFGLNRIMHVSRPPHRVAPYLVSLGILFAALVGVLAIGSKKLLAHCPSCGKQLGGMAAQIAVSTKHCGYCGAGLFGDANAP